jgi:hypothetical protein
VLLISPAVATTKVEEDIDGGPLGGAAGISGISHIVVEGDVDGRPPGMCYPYLRQQAPLKLEKTLMAGPLGGAVGISNSNHHRN